MLSTFLDPTEWALAISPAQQAAAWQQHQARTHQWGRWNAYLNQLCLDTILPWLKAEYLPTADTWVAASAMPLIWDVVNGAAIAVGTTRIALIPTEAIDRSELVVPQEWVDIPSWAADYYLGVQVDGDGGGLCIYGYTTHQQLKTQAAYDPLDRTYAIDSEDLNPDLNALWLGIDRYPVTVTRAALAPIPALASDRIAPLIERLGNPAQILPRLAVPFEVWAAIVENPELHQRLDRQRQTGQIAPVVNRLSDWIHNRIDPVWQTLQLVLSPSPLAIAVRSEVPASVALAIGIEPISDRESRIILQIHPVVGAKQLPGSTQLRLLTADGGEIGRASGMGTETIEFQFRANVGERFQVEIACAGEIRTEQFEL